MLLHQSVISFLVKTMVILDWNVPFKGHLDPNSGLFNNTEWKSAGVKDLTPNL